jgi:hypothetical protein
MLFVVVVACVSRLMASSSCAGCFLDPFGFITLTLNVPCVRQITESGTFNVGIREPTGSENQLAHENAIICRHTPRYVLSQKAAHTYVPKKNDRIG